MSASESYSDDSSTSFDSDLDVVEDYELEVEEFDLPSEQYEGPSTTQDEDTLNCAGGVAVPYEDEPIVDDDRVEKYEEERQREKIRFETLEKRLDGRISTSDW